MYHLGMIAKMKTRLVLAVVALMLCGFGMNMFHDMIHDHTDTAVAHLEGGHNTDGQKNADTSSDDCCVSGHHCCIAKIVMTTVPVLASPYATVSEMVGHVDVGVIPWCAGTLDRPPKYLV